MQLSKRLQAVADLVTPGLRVADVGCDHAYTSIYLIENKISPSVIAMDVNQGPIERAKENVKKFGYSDSITIRKSNGLEKLKKNEADAILIAGMGGALTIQILLQSREVLSEIRELILQPQSEIFKVRKMLGEIGFFITKENMMKEDGKYYVMMKAEAKAFVENKIAYEIQNEEQYYYGKLLLEQQNPILKEFLHRELDISDSIYQSLISEPGINSAERQNEILEKINLINQGLAFYNRGENRK